MAQLLLVRHGQASFASDDYDRLSETGKEQSQVLGAWLHHCQATFDHAFAGDLRRHRETAELCLQQLATSVADAPLPPLQIDPALNEYDHHQIMQRYRPELAESGAMKRILATSDNPTALMREMFTAAMARWMEGKDDHDYTESWPQFAQRCVDGLLRAAAKVGDNETAIVFTSGGVISAVTGHAMGLSPRRTFELNWSLVNSGMSTFTCRKGRLRLTSLNNTAHIDWSRVRNLITYR